MLQEIKPDIEKTQTRTLLLYERSNNTQPNVDIAETIPDINVYTRIGPKFPHEASFTSPSANNTVYHRSHGKQPVPALGVFISATGSTPLRKSTIDYFTPINHTITEYSTVQELLRRSEEATREVASGRDAQQYVINTFDLGVCMKALPLIWRHPDKYKKQVVLPGQFHTVMNYMGTITARKCRGSGYTEILQEAQLVTSGCLMNVISGKAYAKALFCLKTECEALERLLMEKYIREESAQLNDPMDILNLVTSCNRENLDLALADPSTLGIIKKYKEFEDKVRMGHLGKTAVFWFSFIEHCHLVFMMLYSVKTNNFELFHKCNGEMADLFFAYDCQNYSRYMVWLDVFLTNIELSHPGATELLKKGAIAVARSLIPGALSVVDKTMEETFMKFTKSAGGLSGLFTMFGAYQRWCRTTSARAQFFEKTLEMCDMVDDPECPKSGKHRELDAAHIRKSEDAVQRTMEAVRSFTDPFTISDKDHVYSIASGAPCSVEVEADVLRAEEVGKQLKQTFITERFQNDDKDFFDPIRRQKLLTLETCNKKVTLTSTQGKLIQYQEQSNLAFVLLVKSQLLDEPLDLDELMCYSLAPVPHSLGTADGFFAKTNKATMLHFLLDDITQDVPYPKDAIHIEDGMALLHVLSNLPSTFGEICLQVLDRMASKKNCFFSTDCYEPDSIKSQERMRRGVSEKFILGGPATRRPANFKQFLSNDQNKQHLCQLLLRVWGSKEAASRLEKCGTAVVAVEGRAHKLVTSNGEVKVSDIYGLRSNPEETDSRVVLYLNHAVTLSFKSAVVRSPDTDILFILLHHAHSINLTIYLDTGSGNHRRLVNVTELAESIGSDYCSILLGYYVFSGEDCTSAFKGKGKVAPLKKLQKNPKFHTAFRSLGEGWTVEAGVQQQLEQFTCVMYGQARETAVNSVRANLLRKMVGQDQKLTTKSKVDLTRMPPCLDSLVPHSRRVNYRVACYKLANEQIFWKPKPDDAGQGWEKNTTGIMEPVWSCWPVLPTSLIDLLETGGCDDDANEGEDEEPMDYEDMLEYIDEAE